MRLWRIFTFIFILVFSSQQFYSQDYPQNYFRAPMDIPIVLSGNFAELRSNHFHTGIDIKTNGKEGYKIYATADGYISRINVSHWGYGNCIYVTHPTGYTTVYAHCREFPDAIEQFLRKAQRKKQVETITLYPGSEQFPVKKGDVIAYSGNSGSSTAPHLHFEIRDAKTEEPLNPLLFGFDVKDEIKPTIFGIKVYSLNGANIEGKNDDYYNNISQKSGLLQKKVINAHGKIGISINTIDRLAGANNKCGVYQIELYDNEKLIFSQKTERINFFTNRYINTHMDYHEYRYNKNSYHKSFISENNKLKIYGNVVNKGIIEVSGNETHKMKYIVKDVYGNTSELKFELNSDPELKIVPKKVVGKAILDATNKNHIKEPEFEAFLPNGSVYDDVTIDYSIEDKTKRSHSNVIDFHTDSVPIQKYFVLRLKANALKKEHQSKALIVELSEDKRRAYAKQGEYQNGWIKSRVRSFGNYTVMVDTTRPFIAETNIANNKYKSEQQLSFKISDNLSGITSYKVFIDGSYVHSYYTPKKAKLVVPFDKYNNISTGKHNARVTVIDERKNKNTINFEFVK